MRCSHYGITNDMKTSFIVFVLPALLPRFRVKIECRVGVKIFEGGMALANLRQRETAHVKEAARVLGVPYKALLAFWSSQRSSKSTLLCLSSPVHVARAQLLLFSHSHLAHLARSQLLCSTGARPQLVRR